MTDWDGHAPENHMTSLEQWERELRETVLHVLEPFYVDTELLCHKRFIWLHQHFMVRAEDHESILLPHPFCAIFAHFCQFHGWSTATVDSCCGPFVTTCR